MAVNQLLGMALLLPVGCALWVALAGARPNLRDGGTVVFALLTFGTVVRLVTPVLDGVRPGVEVLEVFPGIALAFEVEPLGLIYALVASGLWIVTSIYAFGYMRAHHEENQTRFFVCFAIAIAAALGIAFSRNLFTLFLFYEILTFSTYPLVTHHGTELARRAGRTYLGILVSTSVGLLLLAIGWTWQVAGTLEFREGGLFSRGVEPALLGLLFVLFAFGTGKAALMPVHRWLPAAMVAPTPVSALLHAVAVVKAGVFTVLKISVYVFGIENLRQMAGRFSVSEFIVWASSFTILAASLVALQQDNLKRRLAYSTVSQLSYIVLAASLAAPAAVVGGAVHIATHAMGKITLFFCAGAIYVAAHKTEISDMRGIGWRMPITMTAFLFGSLSIIGLPPFAGAWSKWYLLLGAYESEWPWVVWVLVASSLLNIAYLIPIVVQAFFVPSAERGKGISEAPLACVVPLAITAVGCLVLFLFPGVFVSLGELLAEAAL